MPQEYIYAITGITITLILSIVWVRNYMKKLKGKDKPKW